MTTFAYNNIYLNIDCMLKKLFKNYIVDFTNESENRFIKKETSFVIERAE